MALKVDPRFCEYEVKELRSPVCSRQVNAIFPPHNHKTWSPPISIRPSLYTTAVGDRQGAVPARECTADYSQKYCPKPSPLKILSLLPLRMEVHCQSND